MSVLVNNLTKYYGSQAAIDCVSFSIDKGEVVGFLGPNGAGKTTTMKILSGYISPSEGEAFMAGHNIVTEKEIVKNKIGYLPENNPLYLSMYVREYLKFVAKLHGVPNANDRISEMIELTGLEKEYKKKIGVLSKGYRQRVGLAQAIIHDPEVLILDEPTSGLDPNQLIEIRDVIRQMKDRKTVIFSTHIMQEIQAVCDRVIIINNGKIIADDKIEQLQSSISQEEIIEVLFFHPINKKALIDMKSVHNVEVIDAHRVRVFATKNIQVQKELFYRAVELDNPILNIESKVSSVEDIFQKLTKE